MIYECIIASWVNEFTELPPQFLTILDTIGLVYVKQKNDSSVVLYDTRSHFYILENEHFLQNWNGIVLFIDKNKTVSKIKNKNKNLNWSVIFIFLFLYVIADKIINNISYLSFFYSTLCLSGLFFSILIMQENFGLKNIITSKFCSEDTKDQNNCSAVLTSNGAKVYKNYTLSDICLVIFSTLSIISIFHITNISFYKFFSILSIPIVIYSIWYQKIVLKKWCFLCLSISTILISMFFLSLFNEIIIKKLVLSLLYFICFLILSNIFWINIKPFFETYYSMKEDILKNNRLRRNIDVFRTLLNLSQKVDTQTLKNLTKIDIGNQDSILQVNLFISPNCSYCHKIIEKAYQLYKQFPDDVNLNIYYNLNVENKDNLYQNIAEIIMENSIAGRKDIVVAQLIEWHINKTSFMHFMKKYGTDIHQETKNILASHHNWCTMNNLTYTPIIVFEGRLFPENYEIDELKYFINEYKDNI